MRAMLNRGESHATRSCISTKYAAISLAEASETRSIYPSWPRTPLFDDGLTIALFVG